MGLLKIKILAEDIKLNNYCNAEECPITRALARAGRPDLMECVGIYKKSEALLDKRLVDTDQYQDLRAKLFGMYYSLKPESTYPMDVDPIPVEDFEYDLMLPDDLIIDEATVKATQVEFVPKEK